MRRITRCLNRRLLEISQQALALEGLSSKLHHYLPVCVREHCYAGSFNQGRLILLVSHSGWASQLRYMLPELRDTLRTKAGLYQLISIKITLAVALPGPLRVKPVQTLSDTACQAILGQVEQFSYLPLKQALLHLAGQPVKFISH